MGSVIDYIQCPNCGQEAFSDFYYKTGEEYTNCEHCGYHYSAQIKDAAIEAGIKLNELRDEDWEIYEVKNPHGAYRVRMQGDIAYQGGHFLEEKDVAEFRETIARHNDIVYCSISRLVGDEIVKEILIDNEPKENETKEDGTDSGSANQ